MALVLGTNCGFLLAGQSPSADPEGNDVAIDTGVRALKDTAPVGATKVTEIGWYCDNATQAANFEVGIYDHNVGDDDPENLLAGEDRTNAKGTGAGWKKATGLNITITAGNIYWIGVQLDDTTTTTNSNNASDAGERRSSQGGPTTLPDPYGVGTEFADSIYSFYAVTDASAPSSATDNMNIIGENVY